MVGAGHPRQRLVRDEALNRGHRPGEARLLDDWGPTDCRHRSGGYGSARRRNRGYRVSFQMVPVAVSSSVTPSSVR